MPNHLICLPASHDHLLAILGLPGGSEWIILLILGLLIFGRRLPEVGRSLGRGIVEFKKGVRGLEDDVEEESTRPAKRVSDSAPRQELPRSQPRSEQPAETEKPYATHEEQRYDG
jgi:sec-independent protein translocase protein TatA